MSAESDALIAMDAARRFPTNTCPASRHAQMIAEALIRGETYAMLKEEPAFCGVSIAMTVAALWDLRAAARDTHAPAGEAQE